MIDLHCHLVPGVDDGSGSIDESLAMARLLVQDGVTHVVATPHFNRSMRVPRSVVLEQVPLLSRELARAGIPLNVLPGSEVQVIEASDYRRRFQAAEFCHLGDGDAYTLLEFSWDSGRYPLDAPDLMRWIRAQGLRPIVAHPERQEWSVDDPQRVSELIEAGAWIQINVDSLLGNNGPEALEAADDLIGGHSDVVLSTDAHSRHRCSGISPGLAYVKRRFGSKRAAEMVERANLVLTALVGSA